MNISYNWLKKYINIPYTPIELAEKLTMCGIEVESISRTNLIPEGVIAVEITKRDKHPNADKLSVCTVDTGMEKLKVVCGAPNCDEGKKVPLATVGTVFNDNGKPFKIKKSKLRGVESNGMLCSSGELGIDNSHDGIMELPLDAEPGEILNNIFKSDTVYELEVTSNRPDWLSFIGVAREIKALSGNELNIPKTCLPEIKNNEDHSEVVTIEDYELCPRYTGRIIKNITVKESPEWLKQALLSIGLRPINNIVDISNYVLFELGQPLHVFDLDALKENRVVIRRAEENETIIALDEKEYKLSRNNLVIADSEKPVCIAGIMGGEHSGVTEKTKDILIECAYFNQNNIKMSSKNLGLSSDSSHRFERGVDVQMIRKASDRAATLILELAGGKLCSEFIDEKDEKFFPVPKNVELRFDRVRSLLGTNISNTEMLNILKRLELKAENITNESCVVKAASFRPDIEREADLAEEIIRIYGLKNIPVSDIYAKPGGGIRKDAYAVLQKAREQLVALGLNECINYTLTDRTAVLMDKNLDENNLIEVINPISSTSTALRPSLFTGLLKNIEKNISHNIHNIKIFEIGKVYTANKKFPEERHSACIALTGKKHPERYSEEKNHLYDFFDIKGLIETWLKQRRISSYVCKRSYNPIFKTGTAADIIVNNNKVVSFGETASLFTKGLRLRAPLFIAVVELDQLLKIKTKTVRFTEISQFPATTRDVAVVVDESMENSEVVNCIKSSKCKILEDVDVLDVYRDKSLGEGKKSIAYTLTFRNPKKTLTDKEVNKAHEFIRSKLEKELPLTLR